MGVCSLAGAGDVALRGCSWCVMCCGGHGSLTTIVCGGDGRRWVGVLDDDGGERKRGLWLVVNIDGIPIKPRRLPTLMKPCLLLYY